MITLIWKDLRLFRAVTFTAFLFAVLFYIITPLIFQVAGHPPAIDVTHLFLTAVECSLIATTSLSAIIGGIAFAAERRDGSADFMAMLPLSRAKPIRAKLIAAIGLILIFIAFNFIMFVASSYMFGIFVTGNRYTLSVLLHQLNNPRWPVPIMQAPNPLALLYFTVGCFGCSWLLSSFLKSPTAAAAIPLGIFVWIWFWLEVQPNVYLNLLPPNFDPVHFKLVARRTDLTILYVGLFSICVGFAVQRLRRSP